MFVLEIETGNAAFDDGAAPAEIARILRKVAAQVEEGYTRAPIVDINGNTVGGFNAEAADD